MAHSEETKRKISVALSGKKKSSAHRKRLSEVKKLKPNRYWLGKKRSLEDREKFRVSHLGQSPSIEHRRKLSESGKRAKAHMRSADSSEHERIRKSLEYRLWREAVLKRDNWTCRFCFARGGKIHADHIKPFAYFPELRFAIDNGRTLCVPCHMATPTWGAGPKKRL